MSPGERALREKLGVPADARQVLVLCESSHWDTNWLQTSEEYFAARVEPILLAALAALRREPRRVYCVESLFFLRRFWQAHPELHGELRARMGEGRLEVLSSSLTTPDTLLPHPEAVLRDFELGHAWLESVGLPADIRTAYFPDNFGHSPHLPSLMGALGVRAVGLTRIDGMYFVGADWEARGSFPRAGSTAEQLEKVHRSHDFVWRDDAGAEVLCHWNAHTYFMGDMLAHKGIIRWAGNVFAVPWRTRRHIAQRLAGYVAQLSPFARTPYLLCPIGMDFNDPIVGLTELVARDNQQRFGDTGVWTAVAGLSDYFALVGCHREQLPVLEVDPNPYWMGFLASRPEVKQRPHRIARALLAAEKLSAAAPPHPPLEEALARGWDTLVLSNHHDYIPGTSPDRVWEEEQRPWLDAAEAAAQGALQLAQQRHPAPARPERAKRVEGPAHNAHPRRDALTVTTPHLSLTLSRGQGGCLTSLTTAAGEHLAGLGFDLAAFHDEGGLWRLGHEFKGGRFAEVERASAHPATVEVEEGEGELRLILTTRLCGERFVRTVSLSTRAPLLKLSVEGAAPPRRTVLARFETRLCPPRLEMDTVGGVISRPRERLFSPTFWPVPSRLSVRDQLELHALFESPTAAALSARGALEWIIARNAEKERAWGLLPVLAHPIGGTSPARASHHAALWLGEGPPPASELFSLHRPSELVGCDTPGVEVRAVRRSARGEGLTVRLFCEALPPGPVRLWLARGAVAKAWSCDALGRALQPLELEPEGRVVVPVSGRLTSVRLLSLAPVPSA